MNVQLDTSETYSSNYIAGETFFQGDSYEDSDCTGKIVSYNSNTKNLMLNFVSETINTSMNIVGTNSSATHGISSISYNNDGVNWSANTTKHIVLTETVSNSYDKTEIVKKIIVSANTYNHATNSVVNLSMTETTDTFNMTDGTTLTIKRSYSPVTHYDYELELNEAKRQIRVPRSEIITNIVNEFETLMKG
jgi:hypothetical protein